MLRKMVCMLILLVVLSINFTGCGMGLACSVIKEYEDNKEGIKREFQELKEGLREEINDWMEAASQYSLTGDNRLCGRRKFGADKYVGSYGAEYTRFDGEEYIFGGTSMKRGNGNTLKVVYSLNIQSGKAALYWFGSSDKHILFGDKEEHMIAEATAEDVYEFTFGAGDNFIVLKGEDFTGNLSLRVE